MAIDFNDVMMDPSEGPAVILASGIPGVTPSFTIGEVETVAADAGADVTISGEPTNPVLNFKIPRGVAGYESINDEAGEGDTDYVWSADKTFSLKKFAESIFTSSITFTSTERLYNGSYTPDVNTTSVSSEKFTNFDLIASGSIAYYGPVKEISASNQIPKFTSSSEYIDIVIYAKLHNENEIVSGAELFLSTYFNTSPTTSNAYVSGINIVNGFQKIRIPYAANADPAEKYQWMGITNRTLSEIQKLDYVYVFFDNKFSALLDHIDNNKSFIEPDQFYFTGFERLFKGSYDAEINTTSVSTEMFSNFDLLTSGSIDYYGPTKQIAEYQNIPKLTSDSDYIDLILYAKMVNENDIARNSELYISTYFNTSPNTSYAYASNISIVNGFQKVRLYYTLDNDSDHDKYSWIGIVNRTLSEIQKLDHVYVFSDNEFGDLLDYIDKRSENGGYDVDLLSWGDSLTWGAGGNGVKYPEVCAEILSLTVKNCGVGGETANTIAARQGGNNVIIPAGQVNRTFTVDELLDIFGYHINPLRQGNGAHSGDTIYINGQACSLSIEQTTSTSSDAVYTISGYDGDALAVPVLGKFAGSDFKGRIVTIWVGQNGSNVNGQTDLSARMAIIDSMISHISHERYIVFGLYTLTAAASAEEDNAMLMKYGNKYFSTHNYLVNYGLDANGLTPTAQDTADINEGKVPHSLLAEDGLHLNSYGYNALGIFLADKILSLGYL